MKIRMRGITVDGVRHTTEVTFTNEDNKDSIFVLHFIDDDSGREWDSTPLTWNEVIDLLVNAKKKAQ